MSFYYTMPALPISMASGIKKTPVFNTVRQKSAAGYVSALALQPYPTWQFEFSLDHIQGNESISSSILAKFFGTFMSTCGGASPFLFVDPQNSGVLTDQFGTGNGTTTAFQLSRNINGAVDIVQFTIGSPLIYINGTLNTSWTISATGVITFSSPPAVGAVLTWTGSFYYLCRFSEDTLDSTRSYTVNNGLDQWMIQGVKFQSEFVMGAINGAIAEPGGSSGGFIYVNGVLVGNTSGTITVNGDTI
jgi:hypothetical protein